MLFFNKKTLGLEISDHALKIISLEGEPEKARILSYAEKILPPKIVAGGEILDKKNLSAILKDLLKNSKPQAIEEKELLFALPDSRVFLNVLKITKNSEDLEKLINEAVFSRLPFETDQVYTDWKTTVDSKETREILHVAVEKKILDGYLEVFIAAGLKPIVVEFEAQALARSLFLANETEKNCLILDLGGKTSVLSLHDQDGVRFTKNLALGGEAFSREVAKELGVTFFQAEKMKFKYGLSLAKVKKKKERILQGLLENIIIEIKKSLVYYEKQTNSKVQKIILAGGSSRLPYLIPFLKQVLGYKIVLGDPLSKIKIEKGKNLVARRITSGAVVGAALRGLGRKALEKGVNLVTA